MKVLIGIKTGHRLDYFIDNDTRDWINDKGYRNLDVDSRRAAQRATFLRHLPEGMDYKFFYGNKLRDERDPARVKRAKDFIPPVLPKPLEDEVYLPVMDSYTALSYKTQAIVRYALEFEYDLLFLIDDDTFVYPKQLWNEIRMYDLVKRPYAGAPAGAFHTGNMLFLNRDAMRLIAKADINHYADDLWIGRVMSEHGIPKFDLSSLRSDFGTRYVIDAAAISQVHQYAALHSCKPATMRALYARGFGFEGEIWVEPKQEVGDSQQPVTVYVPVQGQGPDYVSKGSDRHGDQE